ncbi:hypothetical protein DAPPUDRAFT_117278 [Daphnia pulex]|uniref:Uncharacterized protein n=1 Tax=Daphnia pulex TaxID=6669 RepID=E9HS41_DAPPU|nr:hypothetical protein DAPPUDRAFT_117278 [Daphnia pulex]|eukprot:EFX65450.1 hypothetical protein DAPPUDRAFT_117278 [Daphnia pulex]
MGQLVIALGFPPEVFSSLASTSVSRNFLLTGCRRGSRYKTVGGADWEIGEFGGKGKRYVGKFPRKSALSFEVSCNRRKIREKGIGKVRRPISDFVGKIAAISHVVRPGAFHDRGTDVCTGRDSPDGGPVARHVLSPYLALFLLRFGNSAVINGIAKVIQDDLQSNLFAYIYFPLRSIRGRSLKDSGLFFSQLRADIARVKMILTAAKLFLASTLIGPSDEEILIQGYLEEEKSTSIFLQQVAACREILNIISWKFTSYKKGNQVCSSPPVANSAICKAPQVLKGTEQKRIQSRQEEQHTQQE